MDVYCAKCEALNTEDAEFCTLCAHPLKPLKPVRVLARRVFARPVSPPFYAFSNARLAGRFVGRHPRILTAGTLIALLLPLLLVQLAATDTNTRLNAARRSAPAATPITDDDIDLFSDAAVAASFKTPDLKSVYKPGKMYQRPESPLRFQVLDEKVDEWVYKSQVALSVLLHVKGRLTSESITALLNALHHEVSQRTGFRFHKHPVNIFIYAFADLEHWEGFHWVAMLSITKGDESAKVDIDEKQLRHLYDTPTERFGLSQRERIAIWKDAWRLERRANCEAKNVYPLVGVGQDYWEKKVALEDRLVERYRRELCARTGISREQLHAIEFKEGFAKGWPRPRFAPCKDR